MSIITITRGSYTRGKQVAERVAERLGYRCLSREALIETSEEFNIPEIRRLMTTKKGPSFFDRMTFAKEKYLSYIQLNMLKIFQADNVVHHGVAGQFFVKDIEHAVKVLITADIEDRIGIVMERDGVTRKDALLYLKENDEPIIKWTQYIYKVHPLDLKLYDFAIHTKKITVDNAVDMVCRAVELKQFQTTPETQKTVDNLLLAAEVKHALIDLSPHAEVSSQEGAVTVKCVLEEYSPKSQDAKDNLLNQIDKTARGISGVSEVNVDISLYTVGIF
ncbi:MAG: cytidylate kinase-like family protein [Desulfobacteraceae bacterium]|nr:cytidylate kinase-like family protein [Desulfobacteraceae bacterium]